MNESRPSMQSGRSGVRKIQTSMHRRACPLHQQPSRIEPSSSHSSGLNLSPLWERGAATLQLLKKQVIWEKEQNGQQKEDKFLGMKTEGKMPGISRAPALPRNRSMKWGKPLQNNSREHKISDFSSVLFPQWEKIWMKEKMKRKALYVALRLAHL